ncbi:hypothetical protein [Streptomyces sp. NPDC014623]|uniref:hypothetical protein n=1 Tax=Streptomyces sp. NPDC014623 TaxID=3364875 RepID=UPI0037034D2C
MIELKTEVTAMERMVHRRELPRQLDYLIHPEPQQEPYSRAEQHEHGDPYTRVVVLDPYVSGRQPAPRVCRRPLQHLGSTPCPRTDIQGTEPAHTATSSA